MSTPASGIEKVDPTLLRAWPLPQPGESKHDRGHVLVVGGARSTPGGAYLAGLAALRVGAGVLALAVEESVAPGLAIAIPESSVVGLDFAQREAEAEFTARLREASAVVLGPGLDDPDSTRLLLEMLAENAPPNLNLALDAFALGVLGLGDGKTLRAGLPANLVLTPNHQEAERLLGGLANAPELADGARVASVLASEYCAVVAYQRHIADMNGGQWFVPDGNAGLGTSGSGDVLSGAVAGLLARGATPPQAVCWAVYLHAAAGDRLANRIGPLGYLARELLDDIPLILAELGRV